MYILSQAEEISYFQTANSEFTIAVKGTIHNHGPFQDLHDVGRLILATGPRKSITYSVPMSILKRGNNERACPLPN